MPWFTSVNESATRCKTALMSSLEEKLPKFSNALRSEVRDCTDFFSSPTESSTICLESTFAFSLLSGAFSIVIN